MERPPAGAGQSPRLDGGPPGGPHLLNGGEQAGHHVHVPGRPMKQHLEPRQHCHRFIECSHRPTGVDHVKEEMILKARPPRGSLG
jgi:hypothetical protein